MAAPPLFLLLLGSVTAAIISPAVSTTCASQKFTDGRAFERCVDLPQHKAYLHWTHDAENSSVSVGYVAESPGDGGWVAWAINPTATGMIGAQALIAFKDAGGAMAVKTYNVESYKGIKESKLSFEVWDLAAASVDGSAMLFAKVKLPEKKASVNQVWQVGESVADGVPEMHAVSPENLNSKGTLDLAGGQTTSSSGDGDGDSKVMQRNIHGILNVVSWGIMFPLGVIIARYLRVFPSTDPLWFYLHVGCQALAYVIGTAGWGLGMKIGSGSYLLHRNLGIALFCLASLQVTALIYRPHKGEKNRMYWEIYHHTAGFTIAFMGIFNVIKGLHILNPAQIYITAYYSVLIIMVAAAVILEVITCTIASKRESEGASNKTP